jgi:hypothetical protein
MRELFLACAGFCIAASTFAQSQPAPPTLEIRLRLLDYKTGRPLTGRYVQLTVPQPNKDFGYHEAYITAKTGKNGVAAFRFNAWLPAAGEVLPLDDWSCSESISFKTDDVLQRGLVGKFVAADSHPWCKDHLTQVATAEPGVVVCYAHRLNFFQRFHRNVEE